MDQSYGVPQANIQTANVFAQPRNILGPSRSPCIALCNGMVLMALSSIKVQTVENQGTVHSQGGNHLLGIGVAH